MKPEIIRKLTAEINKAINSESQVVYILVEVRKLLEETKAKERYAALNFYCNWVVHVRLEGSAVAKKIVRFFDDLHESTNPVQNLLAICTEELKGIMGIDAFKNDFQAFLLEHGIPSDLCQNTGRWRAFMNQYSEVIADCPLIIKGTKHIEHVIVAKSDSDDPGILFQLYWEPVFKNSYAGDRYCLILPFAA